MSPLDPLDEALLDLLEADARLPVTGLARRLRVARSTVQQRLARLERDGEIAAYTIRRGRPPAPGVRAHVQIVVEPRHNGEAVRRLSAMDEVRTLHAVSGAADLVALVQGANADDLDAVLDRIGAVPGVARTTTSVVLSTKVDRA